MNGYIKERIIKKGKDKDGKEKDNLKVYDVYYRYKDPSTGKWNKTSKKGFRGKREAEKFLVQVNSQMDGNKFIKSQKITVREYLNEWIRIYGETKLRKTSLDGYKRNIEKHIIPCLGNIELQSLTASQIDEFYANKLKAGRLDGKGGLSQKSLLYIHRVLCEALKHAVTKNIISQNVAKDVPNKPKAKKFKNEIFNGAEIAELLSYTRDTYMEVAVALGGVYGMRRGEVLGVRWSDIDFDNKVININQQLVPVNNVMEFEEPKSEESIRTLPLSDEIIDILTRRKESQNKYRQMLGDNYQDNNMVVCNDDGTLIDPRNFSKRFSCLLKKYNMKHIRFHDLRHACATLMLNSGVNLKVTSNWLGHSSIGITSDTYVKVEPDTKRQAAKLASSTVFKSKEEQKK